MITTYAASDRLGELCAGFYCFALTPVSITFTSWCAPQFSSVLQNVQALREQTLMLVHGTADGKSELTPSTNTRTILGGSGPKVINQEIRNGDRGNHLAVKHLFKISDSFPSSQVLIASSFPDRIQNLLTCCISFTANIHFQHTAELVKNLVKVGANYSMQVCLMATTWPCLSVSCCLDEQSNREEQSLAVKMLLLYELN